METWGLRGDMGRCGETRGDMGRSRAPKHPVNHLVVIPLEAPARHPSVHPHDDRVGVAGKHFLYLVHVPATWRGIEGARVSTGCGEEGREHGHARTTTGRRYRPPGRRYGG